MDRTQRCHGKPLTHCWAGWVYGSPTVDRTPFSTLASGRIMAAGSRKKSGAQHRGSAKRLECGVHGALTAYAVRTVEPVDGTPTFIGKRRRGARVIQEMAAAQWLAVADGPESRRGLTKFRWASFFKVLIVR